MKNAFNLLCLLLLPFVGMTQTEVEPNNTISTANSIDYFSSSISGTIGVAGDDDYFEMIAETSGAVKINLDNVPSNIGARMRIYDNSGAIIFTRTASSTGISIETQLLVEENETYYILVESTTNATSSDSYTLFVNYDGTDLCEHNQTQSEACPISMNTTFESKILGYTYGNNLDIDYYEIAPTESGVVKIDLTNVPSEIDFVMEVYGESGALIFRRLTTTLGATVSGQLLVEGGMKYFIKISDRNNNAFSCDPYTMTLVFDITDECEYNQTQGGACFIPMNTTFESKILGYTWGDDLDIDYYGISPTESGVVKIDLTEVPSELDLEMSIYGESGGLIFRRLTTTFGAPVSGQLLVEGGMNYFIAVRDRGDNNFSCDPYTMTLAFDGTDECEYNQTQGGACFIPVNTTFESKILGYTWGDDLDIDYYGISPTEPGVVKIDLTEVPSELDLEINVYDESGSLIFRRLTTTLGAPLSAQLLVEGGMSYFIAVSDRSDNAFSCDPYTMTLTFDDTDACENNQAQGIACFIPVNTTFESKILGHTYGDDLDIDYYGISPEENGVVKIDLTEVPSELDLEINIYDESGGFIFRRLTTTLGASVSCQLLVEGGMNYFIAVSDRSDNAFSCDPYTMTLAFDGSGCELNESFAEACDISPDTILLAKILGNTYGDVFDEDFYKLTIPATQSGLLQIDLDSIPADLRPRLVIYDENTDLVERKDAATPGTSLSFELMVNGGEIYYLEIIGLGADKSSCEPYRLKVLFDVMDAVVEQENDWVKLSPNPVNDMLNLSGLNNSKVNQLEIFNVQGKRIWQQQVDKDQEQLNMVDYSPGIYILLLHSAQGTHSRKIIKD